MYLWLKACHLIAMVAWFAGLFYLFRIFVYHSENKENQEICAVMTVMARRLYRAITVPAMIVTIMIGVWLTVLIPDYMKMGWFHAKLTLVLLLVIYQFYVAAVGRRFARGDVYLTSLQCRIRNEVPTVLLIGVVILAVLKPF